MFHVIGFGFWITQRRINGDGKMSEWKETKRKTLNYSIPITDDQYPDYNTAEVDVEENVIRNVRLGNLRISAWHMVILEKLFRKLRGNGFVTDFDKEEK